MQRPGLKRPDAFSLAHDVRTREAVPIVLDQLGRFGGRILRDGDAPMNGVS